MWLTGKSAVSVWHRQLKAGPREFNEVFFFFFNLKKADFSSWFLISLRHLWQCKKCQRRKTWPIARPFRRPAPPSHASLSSQSEECLSWTTSPTTGTASGLFVPIHRTSSSPPTPKQVLRNSVRHKVLISSCFICVLTFLTLYTSTHGYGEKYCAFSLSVANSDVIWKYAGLHCQNSIENEAHFPFSL